MAKFQATSVDKRNIEKYRSLLLPDLIHLEKHLSALLGSNIYDNVINDLFNSFSLNFSRRRSILLKACMCPSTWHTNIR